MLHRRRLVRQQHRLLKRLLIAVRSGQGPRSDRSRRRSHGSRAHSCRWKGGSQDKGPRVSSGRLLLSSLVCSLKEAGIRLRSRQLIPSWSRLTHRIACRQGASLPSACHQAGWALMQLRKRAKKTFLSFNRHIENSIKPCQNKTRLKLTNTWIFLKWKRSRDKTIKLK